LWGRHRPTPIKFGFKKPQKYTFVLFLPERIPSYRVIYLGGPIARKGIARSEKRINLQKESIMAGLYLGIAVAGLNALVAMGVVIAFALIAR
jgi:hypothetical protein